MSLNVSHDQENDDAEAFLAACQEKRIRDALELAQKRKLPRNYLRHGMEQLIILHQHYEGLGAFLLESGIVMENKETDPVFTSKALKESGDRLGAVLFLNGLNTKYSLKNFSELGLAAGEEAYIQMIDSGNFDVKQENSKALVYAAASGHKNAFHALLKKGADPKEAIENGSDDLRWDGVYKKVAEWSEEFYKINLSMAPAPTPVSLFAAADRKESILHPIMGR